MVSFYENKWYFGFVLISAILCTEIMTDVKPKPVTIEGISIEINASNTTKNDHIAYYNETILPSNSISIVSITNLTEHPREIGFVIIQVHAYQYNVTISYNKTIEKKFHENGTDLGLILYPSVHNNATEIYIHNLNFLANVSVSIALTVYNKSFPVPGACNMEYPIIEAPILVVTSQSDFVIVDTPLAGTYTNDNQHHLICNSTALQYTGYHYYLKPHDYSSRGYFDAIKAMLTVNSAVKGGYTATPWSGISNRRSYIGIPGSGMAFTTIVANVYGFAAAYVPAYTISCHPILWDSGCKMYNTPEFHVLAAILIFIGIIRGYFGSVFGPFGAFIDGCVIGMFATFYILYKANVIENMPKGTELVYLTVGGLTMAIIFATISITLPAFQFVFVIAGNIIVGYIFSALALFVFNDQMRLTAPDYFDIVLLLVVILCTFVFCPPCCNVNQIIISSIWGATAIIQGILLICNKNAALVFINPIRLVAVKNYRFAHITPQLSTADICFLFLWMVFIVTGIRFQLKNDNNSIEQNQNVTSDMNDERQPLISRWTRGSDSVFESPTTNQQFLSRYRRKRGQRWRK